MLLYSLLYNRILILYIFRQILLAIVNVAALNEFEDGAVVDEAVLLERRLITDPMDGLKILGNGELTKKLTVKANRFTASAKEKIEAVGGKAEVE